MKKDKLFNTFIFLSTLARSLIDCFILIILYNKGIGIKYIIFFLSLNYSLCFLLNVLLGYLGHKLTFKWSMIATSFFIGSSYYFLLVAEFNLFNLFMFTILHVLNSHVYWLARHYYALGVLPKHNLADDVGNIIIFSTLALIPVSYIGALLMNNLDIELILIIIVFLYMVSVVPLFKLKETKHERKYKFFTSIKDTITRLPTKSMLFFAIAQFRVIIRYLFPLYLFIYIKDNYEYIGIFNIAVGIASTFFVYFFARKMDQEKKDYLILSGILSCIVYLFKLNVRDVSLMLLIGLCEGLTERMYDLTFNRNLYALGHQYEVIGYITTFEGIQNISRILIVLMFAFMNIDLKMILYISSLMLVITGLIGFDDGKGGY